MSISTKIQWCDSTCNPTMGCDGCELWTDTVKKCYAGTLHRRFGGKSKGYAPTFENVTPFPGRMQTAAQWSDLSGKTRPHKPWLDHRPRHIFISDMSDALSKNISFDYLHQEIIQHVTSNQGQRHQWMWLTKRPGRMAQFSRSLEKRNLSWPANLWAGTSITSPTTYSRIESLLNVGDDTTLRFLSVEPQYKPLDLSPWLPSLDWIIHGGESGHGATPFFIDWARDLIAQCKQYNVAYFLKQLGSNVHDSTGPRKFPDAQAGDPSHWPAEVFVRQMPQRALASSG